MELKKIKSQRRNKRYSLLIFVGIFLLFFSTTYFIYDYYKKEQNDMNNIKKVETFFEEEQVIEKNDVQSEIVKEDKKVSKKAENYIGILEIPKIKLKRGIVDKKSSNNNVSKNIYVLKETKFPDEEQNSHIILASHAGNSYISFFKNLTKLSLKDKVYFFYKGNKYTYEICYRYEIKKTGKAELKLTNTSDITLISCINGTNKQVVYIAKLIDKQTY